MLHRQRICPSLLCILKPLSPSYSWSKSSRESRRNGQTKRDLESKKKTQNAGQGTNVLWILRLLRLVRVVRLGKMSRTALVLQDMFGWSGLSGLSFCRRVSGFELICRGLRISWGTLLPGPEDNKDPRLEIGVLRVSRNFQLITWGLRGGTRMKCSLQADAYPGSPIPLD